MKFPPLTAEHLNLGLRLPNPTYTGPGPVVPLSATAPAPFGPPETISVAEIGEAMGLPTRATKGEIMEHLARVIRQRVIRPLEVKALSAGIPVPWIKLHGADRAASAWRHLHK